MTLITRIEDAIKVEYPFCVDVPGPDPTVRHSAALGLILARFGTPAKAAPYAIIDEAVYLRWLSSGEYAELCLSSGLARLYFRSEDDALFAQRALS